MESAKFFDYIPTTMSDILHSSSSPGLFDEAPFVVGIGSLKEFQEAQALLSNLTYTNESVLWDPFEMARNECSSSLNCLAVDSSDSILVGATNLEYGTAAAAEGSTFYPHRPNYSFNYCTELGDSSSTSSPDDFSNSFVNEYYWINSSMPLLLNTDLSSENPSMTIPCNDLASCAPHDVCLALNEDNIDVISRQSVNSREMSTTGHDIDQKRKMVIDRDILDLEPSSHRKRLCTGEQSVGILSKKCIAGEVADTNDNSSELNEGSSDHGGLVSSKSVLNGMASIAVGSTLNTNGKPGARKCSARDPQSLYARNRREKINERLKILQNLVPNGTKVDISTMLEQAIDYVKFMQLQIKLLSSDEHWMYTPIAFNAGLDVEAALGFNSTI